MKTKTGLLLALTALISVSMACGILDVSGEETATPTGDSPRDTPIVVTATSDASATQANSQPEIESTAHSDRPTATLKQDLNVRKGPGTSYAIITALPGGTSLEVIGRSADGYWWAVLLPSGVQGWVSLSYTTYTNTEDVPTMSALAAPETGHDDTPTDEPSGGGGDDTDDDGIAPSDSDLSTEINIKNGNFTLDGAVSYPSGDKIDKVHVEVKGFDSIKTSGKVIYSLSCVATASPPSVTHIGGSVVAGVVGCGSSWTVFYTNDSNSSNITIQQESNGYAEWVLFASAVGD